MTSNLDHTAQRRSLTSRFYKTEHDLQQMQGLLMEARSRTDDWHYWHVGELIFGFFMVACHLNPQEHIRLWHDDEGKLVGYAVLGEDPSFDCQVVPEYEWLGVETEALAWAETRLAELRKRDARRWSGKLISGARQDDAERIGFLEQHGFLLCGDFAEVNMLCSLDEPIPDSVLPTGFKSAQLLERMKFQTAPQLSGRCGIRGPLATSATKITHA
jgi:hypothetical protein